MILLGQVSMTNLLVPDLPSKTDLGSDQGFPDSAAEGEGEVPEVEGDSLVILPIRTAL